MKSVLHLPRWASAGVVCAATVGLVGLTYPGGLRAAYADLRDSRELTERVSDCATRREQLNDHGVRVANRIAVKEALITDLMDGRTDLDSVAEQFRQMNAQDEVTMMVLRQRFGHRSEEELAVRSVVGYVESRAKHHPTPSDLVANLTRQCDCRFGRLPAAH